MDPVSHMIMGRTLVALDARGRLGAAAPLAAVVGALSPDIDAVLMPFGWDIYLRAHEIGTHSLAGSLAGACATAAIVRAASGRGAYFPLAAAAAIGAWSHLGLDLLSGASLRPGWPFTRASVNIPLVAMADPWLIGLLAVGLAATWFARTRPSVGADHVRRASAVAAATVLLATTAFFAVKAVLLVRAVSAWDTAAISHQPVLARSIDAQWGSVFEWHVFARSPDALRQWHVDARNDRVALVLTVPAAVETPLVARSRGLGTVRNFLATHRFGFAVERQNRDHTIDVLWSDIRFCWQADSVDASRDAPLPFIAPNGDIHGRCALWFGGSYDPEGRALRQFVNVGGWTQARPAAP